jgi:hypothetical protein
MMEENTKPRDRVIMADPTYIAMVRAMTQLTVAIISAPPAIREEMARYNMEGIPREFPEELKDMLMATGRLCAATHITRHYIAEMAAKNPHIFSKE